MNGWAKDAPGTPDEHTAPAAPTPSRTGTANASWRRPDDAPERVALWGVVLNAGLAGVKLAAGVAGSSFALVADAVESIGDIAGSLVVWGALRYGAQPPDEDHPFGHGKAEALAALAVAVLIVGAGIGIGIQSVHGILTPHDLPRPFTLAVLGGVIAIKEAMYRIARRAARRSGSTAGHADALHHRSDAITSIAAFIGISIALIGGKAYAVADGWAALFASVVIIINGVLLVRAPASELMDRAAPEVERECVRIVLAMGGFTGVERCHARKSGRGYRVTMHAEVAPEMSVAEAHALTGKAKASVRREIPSVDSLLIHIEPGRESPGLPSPALKTS